MNLSAPPPPAAPRADPNSGSAICRRDDAPPQNPRATFEHVLQAKRQAPRDEQEDTPSVEAAAAMASMTPAQSLARVAVAPTGAGAGPVDTGTGGAHAAIQTALNANPGPQVTPMGGTEPAAVWEASVRGPQHLTIDVRAERFTSHGAPPSWGLTIGSAALGVELLARHAPRLNERLRKHGVELDHVRIESCDDEPGR
jgi:hypothetical protein